jgi:hypothetical protein
MAKEILIAQGVDAETGQTFERKLTADEITELAEWAKLPNVQDVIDAQEKAKASAIAKLKKLGLTAEEIAAL